MKRLISASLVLALFSCSTVNKSLSKDLKTPHSHGTIIVYEFPNKKIKRFYKKNEILTTVYSNFTENNKTSYTVTKIIGKVLPNDNNVFYFHNEKDNKIFCQFFDNGKSKDTVESTFKLIFPKPINPETQVTRFWHGKEKLLGYSENKAKDIHYLKY